jgi:uncharacterized protein YjbI with pentapeptide repeats
VNVIANSNLSAGLFPVNPVARNANLVREALLLEGWPDQIAQRLAGTIVQETADGSIDMVAAVGADSAAERRRASIDRISGGSLAFNAWAERMASLRRATAGHAPTRAVLEAVMLCDYSHATFDQPLNLSGHRFPGGVRFDGCTFASDFTVSGGRFLDEVSFERAEFRGEAGFEGATFVKADFSSARFAGDAQFRRAEFDGPARFDRCVFSRGAWFRHGRFSSILSWRNGRFQSDAALGSCVFIGDAAFSGTEFLDHAGFDHADFRAKALFDACHFHNATWFKNARFAAMPVFTQARFSGATHFDGVSVPAEGNAVHSQIDELRRRLANG